MPDIRCRHPFSWDKPELAGCDSVDRLKEMAEQYPHLRPCWATQQRKYQDARKAGKNPAESEEPTYDWVEKTSCRRCREAVRE